MDKAESFSEISKNYKRLFVCSSLKIYNKI